MSTIHTTDNGTLARGSIAVDEFDIETIDVELRDGIIQLLAGLPYGAYRNGGPNMPGQPDDVIAGLQRLAFASREVSSIRLAKSNR